MYSYEYWPVYWYAMGHMQFKGENHHARTYNVNSLTFRKETLQID